MTGCDLNARINQIRRGAVTRNTLEETPERNKYLKRSLSLLGLSTVLSTKKINLIFEINSKFEIRKKILEY